MINKKKEIDDLIKKLNHMIEKEEPKEKIEKAVKELEKLLDEYLKNK